MATPTIVVHGGAGRAPTPERVAQRQAGVAAAVGAGMAVLKRGGSSLDAVCAAVQVLEDDPVFNAGRGGVPTVDGLYELDAAVMIGRERRAGAVAAIQRVRNPIAAARAVMEHSPHVLLVGEGADLFAVEHDVPLAPQGWFDVPRPEPAPGTVGAVALDALGHLAAATSTGGRSGQLGGRVGDTPIIGAGTFADDGSCAVSGTGAGEVFVRAVFGHTVHTLVSAGVPLGESCEAALEDVAALGGDGGCIAVSAVGEVAMPFTTEAMAVGWAAL